MEETPVVVDAEVVGPKAPEATKVSPAKDLRNIQSLIANGIFIGNLAPEVVKAYNLLELMAAEVEKNAK
jgi:hypothetical protein